MFLDADWELWTTADGGADGDPEPNMSSQPSEPTKVRQKCGVYLVLAGAFQPVATRSWCADESKVTNGTLPPP